MNKLNKKLRVRIVDRFDTQEDFAQAAGEDPSLVSKIVRGRRQPDPQRAKKWAGLLGCRVDDLFEKKLCHK